MCNSYKVYGQHWSRVLLLAGLLLTAGCSEDPLAGYRQAVAEVTGGVAGSRPELLPYPGRRERALPLEEMRIGFIGYLRLTGCRLMDLISERNSALGKVMPPSRRLAYEVDFLAAARSCRERALAADQPDREFIAELERIIGQKRRQLPRVLWLATFDSPEFQQALSLAASPLAEDDKGGFADSLEAVAYLTALGWDLDSPVDISALEVRYQALQAHEYGGRLFQSLAALTATLDGVARELEVLVARPLCAARRAVEEARVLEQVYRQRYQQRLAPYLERVEDEGWRWLAALSDLLAVIAVEPPPAFAAYRRRMLSLEDGLWQDFEKARRRHDQAWAALLGQCGLPASPGSVTKKPSAGQTAPAGVSENSPAG